MNNSSRDALAKVERLKEIMTLSVTGTNYNEHDQEYQRLRKELLSLNLLPDIVKNCRNLKEFWDFVVNKVAAGSGSFQPRRIFIKGQFDLLLNTLEEELIKDNLNLSAILTTVDYDHIRQAWDKALERKYSDTEGAITMARTLLEIVCKHILDQNLVEYDSKADLPKLYRLTEEKLQLAPSNDTKDSFKKIFGSCQSIVTELGTIRNRLSDAHGRGMKEAKPTERHAELAVNLAGSMAIFLIRSWEENQADW